MRRIRNLNTGWRFTGPDGKASEVNLPHTWNHVDGQDGGNNYWRGTCLYERELDIPEFDPDRERVYLEFHGVNASARVELNGHAVCSHEGGYSTFRADITKLLDAPDLPKRLSVWVDNSVNDRVYPQKADFTFYGGIYRDVNLLVVNWMHFDLDYFGGNGLKITPALNGQDGSIRIETFVGGAAAVSKRKAAESGAEVAETETAEADIKIRLEILDAAGKTVASGTTAAGGKIAARGTTAACGEAAAPGQSSALVLGTDDSLTIAGVHLWNGRKDPYLYTAVATLLIQGEAVDEVRSRFGVRTFSVDPEKGFFLNGRSYPLRGVSRHQDWKGIGNALTKEHHRADMELIGEIGANTVRLAHYQHDQYFYDLCDEYGMVVWAEIPYISEHMPKGRDNTVSQMKELIVQNYNHPSIICWGVSNEITISTKDKKDMLDNHRMLNDLCHKMDPTRLTTLACYAVCGPFNPSAHITDLVSWNLYLGWYVPGLFLNDWWMRFFHWRYPKRPLGYSEYGCEAMPNLHSAHPRRGDHTEEYQAVYHEFMLKCFERNPYLWATHVWNMFDFAADARDQGGEPGMNHKGLVTFDRSIKKDSFYLYKAYWSDEPFVYIAGRRRADREEDVTVVKVYSNQPKVALYVDGSLAEEKTGEKVFTFRVPLGGTVMVEARAGVCKDSAVFNRTAEPNPSYKLEEKKTSNANWV